MIKTARDGIVLYVAEILINMYYSKGASAMLKNNYMIVTLTYRKCSFHSKHKYSFVNNKIKGDSYGSAG